MKTYYLFLICFDRHGCVGEFKRRATKKEAKAFIEEFLRKTIKTYCKEGCFDHLSAVATRGAYQYNYEVRLSKDVTVYININSNSDVMNFFY